MQLILKFLIFSAFYFHSFSGFSQDWQNVSSNDSLTIFAKEIHYQDVKNGIDHQRWAFKYENKTAVPIEIQFNRELSYNGKNLQQEETFSVQIPANTTRQYDASKDHDKTFYVFKKDNEGWIKRKLTNYTIKHLKITTLK